MCYPIMSFSSNLVMFLLLGGVLNYAAQASSTHLLIIFSIHVFCLIIFSLFWEQGTRVNIFCWLCLELGLGDL